MCVSCCNAQNAASGLNSCTENSSQGPTGFASKALHRSEGRSAAERSSSRGTVHQLLHRMLPRKGRSHCCAHTNDACKNQHQQAGPPTAAQGLNGRSSLGTSCLHYEWWLERDASTSLLTAGLLVIKPGPQPCPAPASHGPAQQGGARKGGDQGGCAKGCGVAQVQPPRGGKGQHGGGGGEEDQEPGGGAGRLRVHSQLCHRGAGVQELGGDGRDVRARQSPARLYKRAISHPAVRAGMHDWVP